jgi:hypothetical protein
MAVKNTYFPQYRKLSNNRCFYEILDERHFREIQCVGSRKFVHVIKAEQYPEILRIMDMLDLKEPFKLSYANEFNKMMPK